MHLALQGGPGFCQIAVTNACNARCHFCSFPQVAAGDRLGADPERLFKGLHALKKADFVQAHAADLLGIGKSGLNQKLKKYEIDVTKLADDGNA